MPRSPRFRRIPPRPAGNSLQPGAGTPPEGQRRCPQPKFNSSQAPSPSSGQQPSASAAHETGPEQQPSASGALEGRQPPQRHPCVVIKPPIFTTTSSGRATAPAADQGPGPRDRAARPDPHRHRAGGLLLRPALALAARQQQEHQQAAPPVLPQRHQPAGTQQGPPRRRRRPAEQQAPQDPGPDPPAQALDEFPAAAA
jgi:hypothetical protein